MRWIGRRSRGSASHRVRARRPIPAGCAHAPRARPGGRHRRPATRTDELRARRGRGRPRARHRPPRRARPAGRGGASPGRASRRCCVAEDAYQRPLPAGGAVLNGAGECTGFLTAAEWGAAETPVYLTSTMQLGRVYDAACEIALEQHPVVADDVVIPVVGECDDSFLNDCRRMQVTPDDVRASWRRGAGLPRRGGAARRGCGRRRDRDVVLRLQGRDRHRVPGRRRPHRRGAAADELRRPRGVHRRRRPGRPAARPRRRPDRTLPPGRASASSSPTPRSTARAAPGSRAGSASASPAPARWRTTAAARSSSASAPGCGSTATARPDRTDLVDRPRARPAVRGRRRGGRGGGAQLDVRRSDDGRPRRQHQRVAARARGARAAGACAMTATTRGGPDPGRRRGRARGHALPARPGRRAAAVPARGAALPQGRPHLVLRRELPAASATGTGTPCAGSTSAAPGRRPATPPTSTRRTSSATWPT